MELEILLDELGSTLDQMAATHPPTTAGGIASSSSGSGAGAAAGGGGGGGGGLNTSNDTANILTLTTGGGGNGRVSPSFARLGLGPEGAPLSERVEGATHTLNPPPYSPPTNPPYTSLSPFYHTLSPFHAFKKTFPILP